MIPVLVNHFPDCEPSGGAPKDIGFYADEFRQPSEGYALSFHDYAARVAARYRDDPTIAFWQLVNEAQAPSADGACHEPAAASALAGFAAEMSAVIRAADPNHLIGLGPEGTDRCGTTGDDYALVQEAVDVCGIHQYPDPPELAASPERLPGATLSAIEQCGPDGIDKPIVAGEIGAPADLGASGEETGVVTEATLQRRAALIDGQIRAGARLGLDGALIWQRTEGPVAASTYDVARGDPIDALIGDWALDFSDDDYSSTTTGPIGR